MSSIKTNFEFPRGDDPVKQGQRLAQDLSSNFKAIKNSLDTTVKFASGTATLVAGSVTVFDSRVSASSKIFITSQKDGGTPGFIRVQSRIEGTSFLIISSNGADTSLVGWKFDLE